LFQKQTIQGQKIKNLFDHFVSLGEQRLRDYNTECLGGLEIHNKLKDAGLHHRQVGGLLTVALGSKAAPPIAGYGSGRSS
jgi:hypothetical protein